VSSVFFLKKKGKKKNTSALCGLEKSCVVCGLSYSQTYLCVSCDCIVTLCRLCVATCVCHVNYTLRMIAWFGESRVKL